MKSDNIVIYSDGACSGNPGPGGWGSIVITQDRVIELGGAANATTNNRMELMGTLEALRFCTQNFSKNKIKKIQILTDSVYVIRGITQWIFGWKKRGWKNAENEAVSNQDIWMDLDQAVVNVKSKLGCELAWDYVKGHSGVPGNERCDEIAVAFSKNTSVYLYDGNCFEYTFDVSILPEIKPLPEMKSKSTSATPKTVWYLSYINGVLSRHQSWSECEAVVKGRAAKFKKVTSLEEEAEVKKSWGLL